MHSLSSGLALAPQRLAMARTPAVFVLLAWLVLAAAALPRLALAADAHTPSHTAGHAGSPAGAAPLLPGRSYVVMPGDTLDRVVSKAMSGSPLKNEVLREALVAANARVLPAGKNPRLVPGTVLHLPDPDAVLRALVAPLSAEVELPAAPSPGDSRRRWVRFP